MVDFEVRNEAGRYLTHCRISKNLSSNTILAYQQDLLEFTCFAASKALSQFFHPDTILDYLSFIKDGKHLSSATIRRRIACLRGFFRWLEHAGKVTSPFRGLTLSLQRPVRLPRALSRKDLAAIANATMPGSASLWMSDGACTDTRDIGRTTGLAIRLMAATGMRVGELTAIALADISDDASAIRVSGKGNRERTVFVGNKRLRQEVQAYVRERRHSALPTDCFLINARGERLTPQSMRLRLRKLSHELQISPRATPHRFRHTAATMLLEEGVDIRFVQRLLGHSSISTTEIYTHVSDVRLKAVIEHADTIGTLGA